MPQKTNSFEEQLAPNLYFRHNSSLVRFTPLCLAAERGHLEIVDKLIVAGAEINTTTELGLSPLALAAQVLFTAKYFGFNMQLFTAQRNVLINCLVRE